MCNCINAQSTFPEKYRALFLGFGSRTIDTDPGSITINYVDESPSMDNIENTTEIKDSYKNIGIQLGYKWGKYAGLSHSILFDISLGENDGGLFSYSLGYNFPIKLGQTPLLIRPAMMVGFGNFGFEIGQLENNAGFIQINGKKFYDKRLDVKLTSQVFIYGPEIDLMWMAGDKFQIYANLVYDLSSKNSKPSAEFSSTDSSGDNTSLKINGDNPLVTYNDERLTTLPYDISGLRFTIGIAYVWNYQ